MYACNPVRCSKTPTAQKLASLRTAVDRFHFAGHVDLWCQENCNSHKFESLKKVSVSHTTFTDSKIRCKLKLYIPHEDTFSLQVGMESCEQLFLCLSRYAQIAQHMKKERFLFYFTSAMNLTVTCRAVHLHHCITVCIPEFLFL